MRGSRLVQIASDAVAATQRKLPADIRQAARAVPVCFEATPDADVLADGFEPDLLGLFTGSAFGTELSEADPRPPGSSSTPQTCGILPRKMSRPTATRCASPTSMSSDISWVGMRTRLRPGDSNERSRVGTRSNRRFPSRRRPVLTSFPGLGTSGTVQSNDPSHEEIASFLADRALRRLCRAGRRRPHAPARSRGAGRYLRGDPAGVHGDPSTAIPPAIWQKARGVMILSQFKAGFIFGVKGGYGVLMVKKPNGQWSVPVLIDAARPASACRPGRRTWTPSSSSPTTPRRASSSRTASTSGSTPRPSPAQARPRSRATPLEDLHRSGPRLQQVGRPLRRGHGQGGAGSSATIRPISSSTTRIHDARTSLQRLGDPAA